MVKKEKAALRVHVEQDPVPAAEKIQRQLQRILDSPEFQATVRQRKFLKFIVTEKIAGRAQEIKGYTIATRVFGRKNFNQATDPIVSIQANQLRRALERYYLVAGKTDAVRIDIPKGTYIPTFNEQNGAESDETSCAVDSSEIRFEGSWPAVVVRPFQNLTGDPELNYLVIGLATELAMEITRYQDIRVLMHGSEGHGRRSLGSVARFAIDGSVRKDVAGIKVTIQLIDLSNNMQIWGDMHQYDLETTQVIAFQEHVARVVAAKIASEFGIIGKTLSIESKNLPPGELKTYEAILRYHEFNSNFTLDTFLSAFEALKLATAKEPECGLAWSMLARLYAANYSLELFDLETPLKEAVTFAEKGVRIDPANQRVRGILAYVLLVKNDLIAGRVEVERAIGLNPNSLILMDQLGYLLTLLGDWERGPALIRKAIKHNHYYNIIIHSALWVDWIRQEEYEQAYLETLNFRTPLLFWDPLMKATTLGLLGKYEEGKRAAEELLKLKPDFLTRGCTLIRYYIKFDEIYERIVAGLNQVGLRIE